jgi:TPR repeat protein
MMAAGQSAAQTSHTGAGPGSGAGSSNPPANSHGVIALNPFEAALALKQKGDYAGAIKLLEPEAKWGRGYELAQQQLGECYIEAAAKEPNAEVADAARKKGLGWIIKAADGGQASAQEELIHLSIEGGAFKVEPAEAGKWYLIWKRNPTRYAGGVRDLDPKLVDRLKKTLTEADWTEAQNRATAWKQS